MLNNYILKEGKIVGLAVPEERLLHNVALHVPVSFNKR